MTLRLWNQSARCLKVDELVEMLPILEPDAEF